MLHFRYKKLSAFLIIFFILLGVWVRFNYFDPTRNQSMEIGVSFDPEYAGSLSLDPREVFRTLLSDWRFRYFRLPLHWDKVERDRGRFDFAEMDYFVDEAARVGARVMLAVGNKTPRWPECHTPGWAVNLAPAEYSIALMDYLRASVEHYKNNPAVEVWQVENEPFLSFGDCRRLTREELHREIALVKQIDPSHPVLVADSGELTLWNTTAKAGNLFGMTMYRVVWSRYLGYWSYDWLPPAFYRLKLALAGRPLGSAYIVELQAEPWALDGALDKMSAAEQKKSMDLARMKKNIEFARTVGAPRTYLWGGEWWVWLHKNGYVEIPDFVGRLNPLF